MSRKAERNDAIVAAYLTGTVTWKALAKEHGVSVARIQQIVERQRHLDIQAGLTKRWALTTWGRRWFPDG